MAHVTPFRLSDDLELIAEQLGNLYKKVDIAKDPMFGWVQIINDVTILGEELRRGRHLEAAERTAKALFRLLEFLGYYLCVHPCDKDDFATWVAHDLRRKSYSRIVMGKVREGPSKWILVKFPKACSKCGKAPCHCILQPWIFEERREKSTAFQEYRDQSVSARTTFWRKHRNPTLTLDEMLDVFESIYKNQYYNREPWTLGMHLSEEIGEATIELSRLELAWRGHYTNFDPSDALKETRDSSDSKIDKEIMRMKGDAKSQIAKRKRHLKKAVADEIKTYANDKSWEVFRERVSEKFKEEVSDVFSWLAAILLRLDGGRSALKNEQEQYTATAKRGSSLKCPWCGEGSCTNICLVSHGFLSEIMEKVTKF